MADLNQVNIIGRLTRDPEYKELPSGSPVCEFGVATGRKYKNRDGEWVEETCFVDCSTFGKNAGNVHLYLKKGSQVYVGGRLKFDQWEERETGRKRSKLRVIAENVQFLDNKEKGTREERRYVPPRDNERMPPPPAQGDMYGQDDPDEPPF